MSGSLKNLRFVSVENIIMFVSLLFMCIIFSSWLENMTYWCSASCVSSLVCGSFGCVFLLFLYMACRTDFTSSGTSSVESCLAISPIIILLGRSPESSVAFLLHSCLTFSLCTVLLSGSA
jgi:hypothetical protein